MRKERRRRRAIHAELVRESKDNPGYFRYNITISEKDGREHVVPAYGVDMEDAIERLVWNERIDKMAKVKGIMPTFALLLLVIAALFSMLGVIYDNPLFIVGSFGVCGIILVFSSLINKYLNKK